MNTQPKNDEPTSDKTIYQTPEIIDYGNIESLTLSAGPYPGDTILGLSTTD